MSSQHKDEIAWVLEQLRTDVEFAIGARTLELHKLQGQQNKDKKKLAELSRLIAKLREQEQ